MQFTKKNLATQRAVISLQTNLTSDVSEILNTYAKDLNLKLYEVSC